jgi:NAD+ diphosphatase
MGSVPQPASIKSKTSFATKIFMILPPFSAPQEFKSAISPSLRDEACWFIFSKDQLLVEESRKFLPTHHEFTLQRTLYLGTLKGKPLFAGEVEAGIKPPPGWIWSSLRPLYSVLNEESYAIAGRAMQLIQWDRTHKYCGQCGHETISRKHERCRECSSCGQLAYPKQSMAILALVKKGDQILLARSPQFPGPFYSILAGFVDLGETFEQCVAREVQEEVGIQVKNIRYFGSQPWPFSNSMMVGFTCEWESGEIQIDPTELEVADWYDCSQLPELPPPFSLARILIDHATSKKPY